MNRKITLLILLAICMALFAFLSVEAQTDPYDYDWGGYNEEAAGLAFLGGMFCIVGGIVWFIIAILIAIWVYRDAERRGSSGALWLIIVLITGIIGIIIWLIVRPPIGGKPASAAGAPAQGDTVDRRCPNCGRAIPNDARVCPYCAKKFDSE